MHTQKNFDYLLGTPGFSDTLLKNHFALYEGYVKNCNLLNEKFDELRAADKVGSIEWAELKRRWAWEYNGMRLHELYFGNMKNGGAPLSASEGALKIQILDEWETMEAWEKDFRMMGAMRGIGWVIVYFGRQENRLFNVWVNEHDMGHFAGAIPLLVMDVFEHAYITDYGIKRADYIDAFMKAIDWSVVEQRFNV